MISVSIIQKTHDPDHCTSSFRIHSSPPLKTGLGDVEHTDVLPWIQRAFPTPLHFSYCRYSAYGKWSQTFRVYPNILYWQVCRSIFLLRQIFSFWNYLASHSVLPEPHVPRTQWYYREFNCLSLLGQSELFEDRALSYSSLFPTVPHTLSGVEWLTNWLIWFNETQWGIFLSPILYEGGQVFWPRTLD